MIIINGEIKTNLEIDDGYMFGKGLFETILVLKGRGILLNEHLTRLDKGMKFFDIQHKIDIQEVEDKIEYFYRKLKEDRFIFKINVSDKNIIYSTRKYLYEKEDYLQTCLGISDIRRGKNPLYNFKTTNYLENNIELVKGRANGYVDLVLLNMHEEILEGCISNIFFIQKGEIFTTPLKSGILDGIVRSWVIKNYKVTEKVIKKDCIRDIDGIFITNSIMGIMPIFRIEDIILNSFKLDIIKEIYQKYNDMLLY